MSSGSHSPERADQRASSQSPSAFRMMLRAARRAAVRARGKVSARLARPNLYNLATPERVGSVFTAPSDMRLDERMFLYSFVRGFQPERVLEVGVFRGGSGQIMANAMEENGRGLVIGLDPSPDLKIRMADCHGRYTIVRKPSPDGVPECREAAGGPFDFVLIDGLHTYDQVKLDIAAVLPHVVDGAYIIFHDAFHYGVATAIKEMVEADPRLTDCGYPCRTAQVSHDPLTPYNGFRLLRFSSAVAPTVDVETVVAPAYQRKGVMQPKLDRDALNHDIWYCRAISPCPRCRKDKAAAGQGGGGGEGRQNGQPQ